MPNKNLNRKEARDKLYDIIRKDFWFEKKTREALELGKEYLGVEIGILTRIDRDTDQWKIVVTTDRPGETFPPEVELDLGMTFCRRTLSTDSSLAIHDATNQEGTGDSAFAISGIKTYHGTPFVVDGEAYGTICFLDTEARDSPFSDEETIFAELITRELEREFAFDRLESDLERQTTLASVFNRVLRHNLRNDMTVIRGYIQMMADNLEDTKPANIVLRNIDGLIELSQKARELDRIVASDFERQETDIASMVETVIESVQPDYPDASISLEDRETATVPLLPSFERAVEEVIVNGAKHGGSNPQIAVGIEVIPHEVLIRVTDDGPGIPENEIKVIQSGEESPLYHGSGLGLWLIHWIVSNHEGSTNVNVTDEGSVVTITIPRKPNLDFHQQVSKLAQVRDQYEAAFENAYDAMVIINEDARIVDANPTSKKIYGMERDQLLGRSIPEFVRDDYDFESNWQAVKNGEKKRDTVQIIGDDGVERLVEYSASTDIIPGMHLVVSRERTEATKKYEMLQ